VLFLPDDDDDDVFFDLLPALDLEPVDNDSSSCPSMLVYKKTDVRRSYVPVNHAQDVFVYLHILCINHCCSKYEEQKL